MEKRPNTDKPTMTTQLMKNKFRVVSTREKYLGNATGARAKMMTRIKVRMSDQRRMENREVSLAMPKLVVQALDCVTVDGTVALSSSVQEQLWQAGGFAL